MNTFLLDKGLVVTYDGLLYEYRRDLGARMVFEQPHSGETIRMSQQEFWDYYSTRRLQVVEAFSSNDTLILPPEERLADSYSGTINEPQIGDLPERWLNDLERKLKYVREMLRQGISRGRLFLLSDASRQLGKLLNDPKPPSASTLSRWMREFESSSADPISVVSGYAVRVRGPALAEEDEEFLQESIQQDYLTTQKISVQGAYRKYRDRLRSTNKLADPGSSLLCPASYNTYRRRIAALNQEEVAIARLGREEAARMFRMIKGHLPAKHVFDFVEIDHTVVNCFVIDDLMLLPIGRPIITVLKDRRSRLVLGIYVTFEGPSCNNVHGALRNSLLPHSAALNLWSDIENPWPFGLAATYVSDRGKEFLSARYRAAITSLHAEYLYCGRRIPWHKASIERFFGTIESSLFETLPGKTFSSVAKRGDYDPQKHAVIRFSMFIYLLHKWVVDIHNVTINRSIGGRPLDIFLDDVKDVPPVYPASVDQLHLTFGERHSGALSQEGIRYQHMNFASEELRDVLCDIGMQRDGKPKKVNFIVDNNDLGQIHVKHPRSGAYLCIPNTRPDYANGLTVFQHKYIRHSLEKSSRVDVDALAAARAIIANKIGDELERYGTKRKRDAAKAAQVNSGAVVAGEVRSMSRPFASCVDKDDEVCLIQPAGQVAPVSGLVRYDIEY